MKYKIYAGLGGGFGGATSQGIFEYNSLREAEEDAYNLAIEAYESYGGLHGLTTWDECKQELYDNGDITDDMSESDVNALVDEYYREEMETWLDYYAIEVNALSHYDEEDESEWDDEFDDDDADCFCD